MTAKPTLHWPPDDAGPSNFDAPRHIFDLVIYQMRLIESMSAVEMTRMCEGEFGITRREWRFIAHLAALGPMAPSMLANYAGLDRSRTSAALMSLVSKKLVERRPVPDDHRRATVMLTVAGRRLYEQTFPRLTQLHDQLMTALSPADVRALQRIMGQLGRRLVEVLDRDAPHAAADRKRGGSRRQWERINREPTKGG